eukprot:Skav203953  [mRNA]  locus=scaffold391:368258:369070:- [translate_table: standard]
MATLGKVRDDEEWWTSQTDSRPDRDGTRSHKSSSPLPKGPSRSPSPLQKGMVWRKKEEERQAWHEKSQPELKPIPEEKGEGKEKEKEKKPPLRKGAEASSSSNSRKEQLKVMVDYHNTLEIEDKVLAINQAAVLALYAGWVDVAVCSWCFKNRQKRVLEELQNYPFYHRLWKVLFTEERTNHPSCKGGLCKRDGMVALFDDSADILEDAFGKGIEVYPIKTKREQHQWYVDKGLTEGPYTSFAEAVRNFLVKHGQAPRAFEKGCIFSMDH